MDRGAWGPTVHGVTKSQTQLKRLGIYTAQGVEGSQAITPILTSQ